MVNYDNDLNYIKYLDGVRKEFKVSSSRYILDVEECDNKEFILYVWDRKGRDSRLAKSIIQKTESNLVNKLEFIKDRECETHWIIPGDLYNYFINKGEVTKAGLRSRIEIYIDDEIRNNFNLNTYSAFEMIYIHDLFYYKNYSKFKDDYICIDFKDLNKVDKIINFLKLNYNIQYVKTVKTVGKNFYWFRMSDVDMVYTLIKLRNG